MKFFIYLGLEEKEIKFEPESPTQFPLSPSSFNHSESNDSDKQGRCSAQESSNCMMQNVKTEVYIVAIHYSYKINYKKYKSLPYCISEFLFFFF